MFLSELFFWCYIPLRCKKEIFLTLKSHLKHLAWDRRRKSRKKNSTLRLENWASPALVDVNFLPISVTSINYFHKVLNLKDFTQRDHFQKNDYYHRTLSAAKRTCKCEIGDCARHTSPPISRGLNHLRGTVGEKKHSLIFLE